jgi:RNA polymerase sigma factor (sigma-70 family)
VPKPCPEVIDSLADLDALLIRGQSRQAIEKVLDALPKRDRDLLRAAFFEELTRSELSKRFGVNRDYLRVLLHRALGNFRRLYPPGNTM